MFIFLIISSIQAFQAVSGKDGSLIWNFGKQEAKNDIMNLYTAQIIKDIDGDGTVDILAIHGGDPLQDPGNIFNKHMLLKDDSVYNPPFTRTIEGQDIW